MSTGIYSGNVTGMTIVEVAVNLGSVAANTTEEEDATLQGVKVGDVVIAIKPTLEAGLTIDQVRVDEADSLKITVGNYTGSPIDEASETIRFLVARPESTTFPTTVNL